MPGFGNGPFGRGGFGGSRWSRMVFWESLPEQYRLADEGELEAFADGIRSPFDFVRSRAADYFDLRNPLTCRTQYDFEEVLRLGKQIVQLGELEQRGLDGYVDTIRQFHTTVGRFRDNDVGKELTITGSLLESNNTTVLISRVIDPTTVLTDPLLLQDAGPLSWELRPDLEVPGDQITVEVQSGYVDRIFPGWILYDGRANYEVLARRHFPADRTAKQQFVEQEGVDGTLISGGLFQAVSATFYPRDIGKKLVIAGSSVEGNNGWYEIVSITSGSPQTVELDDSSSLNEDAGPLYWGLLPRSQLDLKSRVAFRGVAAQAGVDGAIVVPSTLTSVTAAFASDDVGRRISIRGSQLGSDGVYEIASVVTPTEITLDTTFASAETSLVWEMRDYTGIGDTVQVRANAPSMISYLAKDFGIQIDTRENEDKQRKWVSNVAGWTNIKGTENAYEYVGALAGFIVTVSKLYRITQPIYNQLLALGQGDYLIEFGESESGRFGNDGAFLSGVGVTFTSATAQFRSYDAGRQLIIANVNDPLNEGIYTIDVVLSSTSVRLDAAATVTTPDYGSGGTVSAPTLRWSLARLYTTRPPLLPKYDDIVHSLMKDIIDFKAAGTSFDIDKYCWEDDFDATIPVDLISVSPVSVGVWSIVIETKAGYPGSGDAIASADNWQFVDTAGSGYFLEDLPTDLGGGQFSFTVYSLIEPSSTGGGDPALQYSCSEAISCGFCPSNKVAITLEVGPELVTATGAEIENLLQRALDRMEQAKPIHVEFVVTFKVDLPATLSLTAEIEAHPDIGAFLEAYLTPLFDDIEGDVLIPDGGLTASIEPIIT